MPMKVREAEFRAVYKECRKGRLSQKAAAARLGMSARSFRRYVDLLRTQSSQWWEDRYLQRPTGGRAPDEERAKLRSLYSDHYAGWKVQHFYEKYRDEHGGGRSYTWVKDSLQAVGLVERRARPGTPKQGHGKDARQSIGRRPREGMLIHQISARGEWTAGCTWDLVLTMDDATNRVHSGFLVEEVGIWSVFRGIRETLERRGSFDGISVRIALPPRLTAADSAFGGSTRSQIERAISEVCPPGPPEPELRTRQMRMIGTMRGRLPRELAAEGIADLDLANEFLARFWPGLNEALGKASHTTPSAFATLSPGEAAALVGVLCLKHHARVGNGNRLFCKGTEVEIPEGRRQQLNRSREYRIHEYEDGSSRVFSRRTTGLGRLTWTEFKATGVCELRPDNQFAPD